MATPKPGSKPEPPPIHHTIETDVSPLHSAEIPIPTVQSDVSPLHSDGSTSIGIFTPEALLPRSNAGTARPPIVPLRPSATGAPRTVSSDPARAASASPALPGLAPWSTTGVPAVGMTKFVPKSAPTPATSVSSINGLVDQANSTGQLASPVPGHALGAVGPYLLRELIGEGGMGLVYRAEDSFLKRSVALKIMRPDVSKDERSWKRFLMEAQATAALKNDRIATIYQIGEDKGRFYLAMELLWGEPLEARLRRGPMPIRQVIWVVREAALGLAVAHEAGFVHRDIKPGNLWLETKAGTATPADPLHRFRHGPTGAVPEPSYIRVKILDFGLVRLAQDEENRKKSVVGTPAYMSPEQAAGHSSDARSDIFSLGVVMFRMLTGQLPFEGETTMELLTALTSQVAPPVTKYNPSVPPALSALVTKMLSRDPVARPPMASTIVRELDAIERTILAPPPKPKQSRRHGWLVPAIMVSAVVVFGGGWVLFHDRSAATDETTMPIAAAPANAVMTPEEAARVIGDQVKVEFVVGHIDRSGDVAYLYESAPKGDDVVFRVSLPRHIIAAMRKRGSFWPDTLQGARLRLQGQVSREGRFAEILVGDSSQFEKIVYNDRLTTSTPPQ
jgi:serine/threonine protein kinase